MLRLTVFAVAVAGLAAVAVGVADSSPVVFWGTDGEIAAVAHGRTAMLVAAGVTVAAAVAIAVLGERPAAALVAAGAALPAAVTFAAPGTALGLIALPPALAIGLFGALMGCSSRDQRPRQAHGMLLGLLTLAIAGAGGLAWGLSAAAAFALVAYGHARAGRRSPRVAAATLVPTASFALLATSAVLVGGTLAA
jgi:hypothetical protein